MKVIMKDTVYSLKIFKGFYLAFWLYLWASGFCYIYCTLPYPMQFKKELFKSFQIKSQHIFKIIHTLQREYINLSELNWNSLK